MVKILDHLRHYLLKEEHVQLLTGVIYHSPFVDWFLLIYDVVYHQVFQLHRPMQAVWESKLIH
jgi:hypothetical protein